MIKASGEVRGGRPSRWSRHVGRRRQFGDRAALLALFPDEVSDVAVFIARRVLDAEIAAALAGETFAHAMLHPRRIRGRTREEAVSRIYAIAITQIQRCVASDDLELPATTRLRLDAPQLSSGDVNRLEDLAGITAVRGRAQRYIDRLAHEERDALRMLLIEARSYDDVARALGVTDRAARSVAARGLRRVALQLDARSGAARLA